MQNQHPDFLVLGGDIVEENTSYESMQEIFAMAGKVKTKYGVYYVYGNHDRQPYTTNKAYTEKQLDETIEMPAGEIHPGGSRRKKFFRKFLKKTARKNIL